LIIWKEFAHIKADPLMSRLIVFPVLAQIFIVGYALTLEVKHTPLLIVDRSNTPQSHAIVETCRNNSLFSFKGMAESEARARALIDNGIAKLSLVIPQTLVTDMEKPAGARLQMLIDGQDANSAQVAAGYLTSIINGWTMERLRQKLAAQGFRLEVMIPVTVTPSVLFNPLLRSSWYMIPALVVLLVTIITGLLTGLSIVKEKELGTFEQLMVTPIRPVHVVIGKIIPFTIIGFAEILAFFALATWWFGIPFRGNFLTLLLFAFVYMISTLGIGILASTIARTMQQVLFFIWFVLIFFILLSGFFIPIENMPAWVQTITMINPVRYFMFVVREIFLKGSGLAQLWHEGVAMLIIGGTVFSFSLMLFQRRAK
jgi:ABC-2 type transport system permease protein